MTATTCRPWCAYQGDPVLHDTPESACLSVQTPVSLKLMDPIDCGGEQLEHDFADVYLRGGEGARPDRVYLAHNLEIGMEMTADEALRLAAALTAAAETLEAAYRITA